MSVCGVVAQPHPSLSSFQSRDRTSRQDNYQSSEVSWGSRLVDGLHIYA
jgi:hypothetical protein